MDKSPQDFESTVVFILFVVGSIIFQILKVITKKKASTPQRKAPQVVRREEKKPFTIETPRVFEKKEEIYKSNPTYYSEEKSISIPAVKKRRLRPSSLKQMVISKEILHNPFIEEIFKK